MNAQKPLPDIEIARKAAMLSIEKVAEKLGIPHDQLERFGTSKAKVSLGLVDAQKKARRGKLILVSAITPTPAGEGKTTTTIGLGDGLNRIGKKAAICLREPSLGPCFGMKGGAAGGGYAQVVPMEDINLHFTGDFHAIGLAHNLLAAAVDNHLQQGNRLGLDPRQITWRRVLDMNERALRHIVVGLGGTGNSVPRESGFDITAASEIMAVFCLSESLQELKKRMGNILVGYTREKKPVTARDLKVQGAMAVLLKDALQPNLVQTLENNPAFVHGGPFANIAHGCNTVIATKLALGLSDYTITEAGFGADLGAEKFFDIKCRKSGLDPNAVVLVATIRALKYHGGVALADLGSEDVNAVTKGMQNLQKHIENIRLFGVPVIVAVNVFSSDSAEEIQSVQDGCGGLGVPVVPSDHWARGGAGAEKLAEKLVELLDSSASHFTPLYPDEMPLWEKARTVAQKIYGAVDITADSRLRRKFKLLQESGYGHYPVCMAKTQYSFSTDPKLRGRPEDFHVPIQDISLSAGAEFLVVKTGDIMTMPGLPKIPAAEGIDIDDKGEVVGLF